MHTDFSSGSVNTAQKCNALTFLGKKAYIMYSDLNTVALETESAYE